MWRSRNNRDGTTVVCIACGTSLARSEAREYDKLGNRWERHGKSFEHLCKECYRELCHQPRDELEALLVDVEQTVDADGDTEARDDDGDDAGVPNRDAGPTTDREIDPTNRDAAADPTADRDAAADQTVDQESEANLPVERDPVQEDSEHDDTGRTFLAEYFRAVEDRYGSAEEPGRGS
jgi:hypothetical protein